MAISPVGDIVMEAIDAADPQAAAAARAKLASGVRAAGDGSFTVGDAPAVAPASPPRAEAPQKPFQRFEAMVLQNFIESMLPKDADSAFGGGMAGDMWKSMMAEKLAGVMSERGGIGIAGHLLRDHYTVDGKPVPIGPAAAAPSQNQAGQAMLSSALVEEMQRKAVGALTAPSGGV